MRLSGTWKYTRSEHDCREAHHSRGKKREKKGDLSRSQKDNEIER